MAYELFYWPGIQGRCEFVRLALEEAGAAYVDVGRGPGGVDALMAAMKEDPTQAFAPPFLRGDGMTIGQTAAILLFLGERLPALSGARRLKAHTSLGAAQHGQSLRELQPGATLIRHQHNGIS